MSRKSKKISNLFPKLEISLNSRILLEKLLKSSKMSLEDWAGLLFDQKLEGASSDKIHSFQTWPSLVAIKVAMESLIFKILPDVIYGLLIGIDLIDVSLDMYLWGNFALYYITLCVHQIYTHFQQFCAQPVSNYCTNDWLPPQTLGWKSLLKPNVFSGLIKLNYK